MSVFGSAGSTFPSSSSFSSFTSGSSQSSSSGCQLSPAASAFSAMISAFVGSVINGLTSGWLVAFMTGWIAWLAMSRVLVSGSYLMYRTVTNTWGVGPNGKGSGSGPAEDEAAGYLMSENDRLQVAMGTYGRPATGQTGQRRFLNAFWPSPAVVRGLHQLPNHTVKNSVVRAWIDLNQDVTVLGWIGWVYGAVYAPISQIIWAAANSSRHDVGAAKIVKGLTVAVTALPLCIDCKVRYADSIKWKWGGVLFNVTTSVSTLLQGTLCVYLLISGVVDSAKNNSGFPIPIAVIYPIFSLVWMLASFLIMPIRDGGRIRAGQLHWWGYFIDVGMGAFAGIFLAAPAFALYNDAQFDKLVAGNNSNGLTDLGQYLACKVDWWKKLAAVVP